MHVRTVRPEDVEPYRRAVFASAERMRRWNPVNPDDLPRHIAMQTADHRTFFVFAADPAPDQPVVGRVNLTGAVRGRFRSVSMGYDAYDPYAGRGLFAEGLRLVVDLALADAADGGMDLHRVEAVVQPGNTRSAGLLRSLGFRHEGSSRRLLFLPDDDRHEQWRDHERYAVTREEWPAEAYAVDRPRRLVVLLDTSEVPQGPELARAVAAELGLPLLPADLVAAADGPALVEGCPAGAVVAGPLSRSDLAPAVASLRSELPGAVAASVAGLGPMPDRRGVVALALSLRTGASG